MKKLFFAFHFILLSLCDSNSQCSLCFSSGNFDKYCPSYLDYPFGTCCLKDTGGSCLKDYYLCTDIASTSFTHHKYAFCSYNQTICGSLTRTITASQTPKTIYTSLEFTSDDICPYVLVSDSDLMFNTQIGIKMNTIYNAEAVLLTGSSLDSIESQKSVAQGDELELDGYKLYTLIIKPTSTQPFVQFTVENVQKLSIGAWAGIISAVSLSLVILLTVIAGLFAFVITKKRLLLFKAPSYNRLLMLKVQGQIRKFIPTPPPPHLVDQMQKEEIEMTPMMNPAMQNVMNQKMMDMVNTQPMLNNEIYGDNMGTQAEEVFNPPMIQEPQFNNPPPINQRNSLEIPKPHNSLNQLPSQQNLRSHSPIPEVPQQMDNRPPQSSRQVAPTNAQSRQPSGHGFRGGQSERSRYNEFGEKPKVQIKPYKFTFD